MQKKPNMQTYEDEHRSTYGHDDKKEYIILLERAWRVEPRPFTSDKPIIGALIAAFRRAWNNIAARWYVQGLLEQQVPFNHLVASVMAIHDQQFDRHAKTMGSLERQLADLAHQLSIQAQCTNLQGELIYDRGLSIGTLAEEIARSNVHLQELHDELRAVSEQLQQRAAEGMSSDSSTGSDE